MIFRGVIPYLGVFAERSTAARNCSLKRVKAYGQTVELNTHVLGDHAVSVTNGKSLFLFTYYINAALERPISYAKMASLRSTIRPVSPITITAIWQTVIF